MSRASTQIQSGGSAKMRRLARRIAATGSWSAGFAALLAVALQEQRRRAVRADKLHSLLDWSRYYLPQHFHRPASAMQSWLAHQLDDFAGRRGNRLNVIGPRGGAKSTVGTLAYVLRMAVEAREPYIWIVSDTRLQAAAHLENIKTELVGNSRLLRDYPYASGRGPAWRAGSICLSNGVQIAAFSTGQKIRGYRHRQHRPTLIVCDDLQNDRHIESERARRRSMAWFGGTLLQAGTGETNVLNLATALHRDALAMQLTRTPGWRSRLFRAIEKWPTRMDLWEAWEALYADVDRDDAQTAARAFYEAHRAEMDAGAEVLWPAQEDLYALMCRRAEVGRDAFEREKQSTPIQPDMCEWPENYFDSSIWFERWPAPLELKVLALDPSKGRDDHRGDYSAYVLLGVADGTLYVEADLARRPTPQLVADGVGHYQRFHPDLFGMESNQFQELLGTDFAEEFRRQGLLAPSPWLVDNRVNKRVRIRRLGPYLAERRLRFKADSPATRLLVEQLRDFPIGDHDDGPDALEMAIRLAVEHFGACARDDGLGNRLPISA